MSVCQGSKGKQEYLKSHKRFWNLSVCKGSKGEVKTDSSIHLFWNLSVCQGSKGLDSNFAKFRIKNYQPKGFFICLSKNKKDLIKSPFLLSYLG